MLNRVELLRTRHTIYSFLVRGKYADKLLGLENEDSFGSNSPFAWLHHHEGKMLLLSVNLQRGFTFMHYVGESVHVPYRYMKNFRGKYRDTDGSEEIRSYTMYVRDLDIESQEYLPDAWLEEAGVMRKEMFSRYPLKVISLPEAYDVVADDLLHNVGEHSYDFAFVDEKRAISFSDLRMEARKVASVLIRMGVRRQPIAVFLDKSASCVAAFLGVAYSGNFYTPLDTMMPETRIRKILDTLQPMAVITDKEHKEQAVGFANGAEVFTYEAAMNEQVDESSIDEAASHVIDTDVCYVLFTSGST